VNPSLTGSAGVYFVAARLNALGFHCATTFGNVPSVDILVSSISGGALVSLQVKTANYALREKGRGPEKKPHHYEWDIGWKSALLNSNGLTAPTPPSSRRPRGLTVFCDYLLKDVPVQAQVRHQALQLRAFIAQLPHFAQLLQSQPRVLLLP